MSHVDEELLRSVYDAATRGAVGSVLDHFNEDVVWHVGGRNLLSGDYHGRYGDYHGRYGVSRFFAELSQLSGGSFELEVREVLASDEHVAVLVRERARRDGRASETDSLHLWRLRDGQFAEWWRYPVDTYADDEFWS